jgi:hypothetical protein
VSLAAMRYAVMRVSVVIQVVMVLLLKQVAIIYVLLSLYRRRVSQQLPVLVDLVVVLYVVMRVHATIQVVMVLLCK